MSKLSFEESITAKDQDYYLNLCSGANKIKTVQKRYGQDSYYQVEDKVVQLVELAYATYDDFDLELSEVIIHDNLPY